MRRMLVTASLLLLLSGVAGCNGDGESNGFQPNAEQVRWEATDGDPDEVIECPGPYAVRLRPGEWIVINAPDGAEIATAYGLLVDEGLEDADRVTIRTVNARVKKVTWGQIKASYPG